MNDDMHAGLELLAIQSSKTMMKGAVKHLTDNKIHRNSISITRLAELVASRLAVAIVKARKIATELRKNPLTAPAAEAGFEGSLFFSGVVVAADMLAARGAKR